MHVTDSPELAAFRTEVRDWIATTVPAELKGHSQGILGQHAVPGPQWRPLEEAFAVKGWEANAYPKEYGGSGLDPVRLVILLEEMARAGMRTRNEPALNNIVPVLLAFGTPEQKERFIPPTLRREIVWAQGYSEPGAGSDLASLQLRAEPDGADFVLNGQKIWSSMAHHAHWMFVLVRTDAQVKPRHAGISFLLVDATTPGITVRPLITLDGYHHFNEVFYENVRVPQANLVGELNGGWKIATTLLGFERFNHSHANPLLVGSTIDDMKALARRTGVPGAGVVWEDTGYRRATAAMEMDNDCMRANRFRALTAMARNEPPPGQVSTVNKLFGTELMQRVLDGSLSAGGPASPAWETEPLGEPYAMMARHAANVRGYTLGAGSSEIQRNIIAKRVLGLPD